MKGRITYPPLDPATINRVTADTVSQNDRRYFEEHPEATHFRRTLVAGEAPRFPFQVAHVQINKLESNLRSRFYLDRAGRIRVAALDYDGRDRAEFDRYTRIYGRVLRVMGVR